MLININISMEKTTSVIIPNYNGINLLKKNLPKVIQDFKDSEIILVDDASIDGSQAYIKEKFPKVKLIEFKNNRGFSHAVNVGAKNASGKYIILLNTDVVPKNIKIENATQKFKNEELFAIGFADVSYEDGNTVIRGRGGATFKRGFVSHFKLPSQSGETLWVSGGSCIIDKKNSLSFRVLTKASGLFIGRI